jgi:hypothetical protein
MKFERLLQLIGIAIFLILTSLTYYTMTPVIDTTNTTQVEVTNNTTSTTANTTGDNSIITNVYRTITAIATGAVISLLSVFLLRTMRIESLKKQTCTAYKRSHSR